MLFAYYRTNKSIKIGYARNLISTGKDSIFHYELFEDKIVSHVGEVKREYFYHQITKFFETKHFLLIHLQHNLHITIEKSSLNGSPEEVKAFLMNKCTVVKKKKFIQCENDKKWSLILLIALFVVSIAGIIVSLMLKRNYL
jgi:hypothetical protein